MTGQYIAPSGGLNYFLTSMRRFKPYTLSEAEEKIINLKDVNGCEALVKIYEILTNGFTFDLEIEGMFKKTNPRWFKLLLPSSIPASEGSYLPGTLQGIRGVNQSWLKSILA